METREIIKFDLMGWRRLEFDEDGLTWRAKDIYPVPLPGAMANVTLVSNETILYSDVRWIGSIRRRQWWTLPLGLIAGAIGVAWMATYFRDWGPFAFAAGWSLFLGAWPVWLFVQGRWFLTIAAETRAISIPQDRKRRQVRRAVEILRERCTADRVRWEVWHLPE